MRVVLFVAVPILLHLVACDDYTGEIPEDSTTETMGDVPVDTTSGDPTGDIVDGDDSPSHPCLDPHDPLNPELKMTKLDFTLSGSLGWPACVRDNASDPPDSIGVTVTFRYDFITPLPDMISSISGGNLSLGLTETTVMALNPSSL